MQYRSSVRVEQKLPLLFHLEKNQVFSTLASLRALIVMLLSEDLQCNTAVYSAFDTLFPSCIKHVILFEQNALYMCIQIFRSYYPLPASMTEDQSGAADCYGKAVPMAMSSKVSQNQSYKLALSLSFKRVFNLWASDCLWTYYCYTECTLIMCILHI